jgi:activating signal cointegrator complex subunit 1
MVVIQLHCTLINTVHRKPRSKGARKPFSYPSILASPAFQAIGGVSTSQKGPKTIDLGVWDVDEVQICEMGSYGPEGEYVSCGGCSLL